MLSIFKENLKSSFKELSYFATKALQLDKTIFLIIILQIILNLPAIFFGNNDARMLDTFANDDAFITMQLDGMFERPYGNPANYLKPKNENKIPTHWYDMRYFGIIYYGGLYLDLAFLFFAPFKALGFKIFPLGPLILRFFSCVFGVLSLLTLYNFSKRYFGNLAASVACIFLMGDIYFNAYSHSIHPETLLLFLALLFLQMSISYANEPGRSKLIAMGILIGAIHGTKMAAPWVLPIAMTVICLSYFKNAIYKIKNIPLISICRDGFLLGISAIFSFIITTPYSILDSYYFKSVKVYFKYFSDQSPLYDHINIINWIKESYEYFGSFRIIVAASLAYSFIQLFNKNKTSRKAHFIVFFFLVSNFLWYSINGHCWVIMYYLMPAIAILGVYIGLLITDIFNLFSKTPISKLKKIISFSFLCIVTTSFFHERNKASENIAAKTSLKTIFYANSLPFKTGNWMANNVPPGSKIQHDGIVYLNPKLFPDQNMGTNILQYDRIRRYKPEYIVLTDWSKFSNWIPGKLKTQKLQQCDSDLYSVRIYQDLISEDDAKSKVNTYILPHVKLLHVENHPTDVRSSFVFKIEPEFYQEWNQKCGNQL